MTAFGYFLWVICCENITAGFIRIFVVGILMSLSWFMAECGAAQGNNNRKMTGADVTFVPLRPCSVI